MRNYFILITFFCAISSFSAQSFDRVELKEIQPKFWQVVSYGNYNGKAIESNSMVVESSEGLILIDSPWGKKSTQHLLDELKTKFKQPIKMAVFTHSHEDKTAGLAIIKEQNIPTYYFYKTWRKLLNEKNSTTTDSILFKTSTYFDLGEQRKMKIYYPGDGHTKDNVVVFFPKDKLLYGGCFLKSKEAKNLGYIGDANVREWKFSLRKLRSNFAIPVKKVMMVPGHGEPNKGLIRHTIELVKKE